MYANDPAKLDACNEWVDAARPLIQTYLSLDDEAVAPLNKARSLERVGRRWNESKTPIERNCDEAQDYIKAAAQSIYDMLDGIRDDFICDERVGIYDDPDAQEEADAFNDWLTETTVSVDAAVKRVSDEQWNVFMNRSATIALAEARA